MGQVARHTRVISGKIDDSTIAAADIASAAVTEPKFSEHFERGTINAVTATGRYKSFTTAYGAAPSVVVSSRGAIAATLAQAPVAGSFKARLTAAGTLTAEFLAWGTRA